MTLNHFAFFSTLLLLLAACPAAGSGQEIATPEEGEDPRRIAIGMYINDIHAIDLSRHSYGVDFYLWFRWDDPEYDPVGSFEFMNPFDPEALVQTVIYDEPKVQPDGSLYQCVRAQGLFTSKFPVHRYPFDDQVIEVAIEDSEAGAGSLQFYADEDGLVVNQEIRLPGFRIHPPELVIRDKPYATNFGDLTEPDVAAYSRAEFRVPVTRPYLPGIFKTFVPILLIILSAGFALILDPEHVEARIGLAITALLTLVAMQFTMLSGLPEVAYLTLLDQVYLVSFLYVLTVIGIVVYTTRIDDQGAIRGRSGAMARIIKCGPPLAYAVTTLYLVTVLLILWVNLL